MIQKALENDEYQFTMNYSWSTVSIWSFFYKIYFIFFLLRHHFTPVNCWWSDCTTNKIYKNKYLIKTRGEDQRIFYHSFFLLPYVCFCVRFVIVAITIPIRCYIPIFCLLLIKQRQQLAKVWLKTIHSSI